MFNSNINKSQQQTTDNKNNNPFRDFLPRDTADCTFLLGYLGGWITFSLLAYGGVNIIGLLVVVICIIFANAFVIKAFKICKRFSLKMRKTT